jgi:hypothetical protein
MSPFSLETAFKMLRKYLGIEARRSYSMGINAGCLQIRSRSKPNQTFTLKRGGNKWEAKINGPRSMLIELEEASLSKLFKMLKSAITEEGWCVEFAPIAISGEEAFA